MVSGGGIRRWYQEVVSGGGIWRWCLEVVSGGGIWSEVEWSESGCAMERNKSLSI